MRRRAYLAATAAALATPLVAGCSRDDGGDGGGGGPYGMAVADPTSGATEPSENADARSAAPDDE